LIARIATKLEIPRRLRAVVRARESSLILLAALVGVLGGIVVAAMGDAVDLLHEYFFNLQHGERLSARLVLNPVLALSVPLVGGVIFGIATEVIRRWRPEREIDPIEANALHGGRMSLLGSIIVAAQTVWSSGVGASVGLEAGYTQLASGIASRIGNAFRLRRGDLRILVGCGAAAGIAGAFGAPLAGAFYGFELIIGSYSPTSLAPVGLSALIGFLVARSLSPAELGIVAPEKTTIAIHDLVLAATLGLLSALLGMLLMRGVAFSENMFARLRLRPALRTMAGGVVVGLLAIVSPQVMSSGHGALRVAGMLDLSFRAVALLFVLKIVASIASLGSGFRGGMFFSSLLIGALGGHLLAVALTMFWPTVYFDPNAYAVIGMSALSASVIGGPLTMIFIAGNDRRFVADHRGAHRRDHFGAGDARSVRLLVRDLALPSARRNHPQRRRCRLDARSHRRENDAPGRADGPRGFEHSRVPRGVSARLGGLCNRRRRARSLCRPCSGGGRARRRSRAR
jgi:CIC family chloride channel protein